MGLKIDTRSGVLAMGVFSIPVLFLTILFLEIALSTTLDAKPIFSCLSPTQSFDIKKDPRTKKMTGVLYSTSQKLKTQTLSCEEKSSGYVCRKDDYIATVLKGTSGRMIVDIQLAGDFDMESGHLYTIFCRETTTKPLPSQVNFSDEY